MDCLDSYWTNQVHLGGSNIVDSIDYSDIDTVITLASRPVGSISQGVEYKHLPLSDIPNTNTQQEFATAVTEVVDELETGNTVVVHCEMGQSRSVITLATALSELCQVPLEVSLNYIKNNYSGTVSITNSLQDKAEKYTKYAVTNHNDA